MTICDRCRKPDRSPVSSFLVLCRYRGGTLSSDSGEYDLCEGCRVAVRDALEGKLKEAMEELRGAGSG